MKKRKRFRRRKAVRGTQFCGCGNAYRSHLQAGYFVLNGRRMIVRHKPLESS